jgi:hypothetical protein
LAAEFDDWMGNRQVTGRAKPSDLSAEFSRKLELVINLNTAKALGLTVLPTLLAHADKDEKQCILVLIGATPEGKKVHFGCEV